MGSADKYKTTYCAENAEFTRFFLYKYEKFSC